MSSDPDSAAATVAIFDALYTGNYCAVAGAVLFIFDTLLTFDREVAYFWTAKRVGGASLLFFANKWISMTVCVMVLVGFASPPSDVVSSLIWSHGKSDLNQSCSLFVIARRAMVTLQYVPGAAFSALRTYVLSRSKPLGLFVAVVTLAPAGANLDHEVVIISRAPLIAADMILIYITWATLSGWTALTNIQQSKRPKLSDVLFRGGVIYFVILFLLNVLHLVFSATSLASDDGTASFITEFTAPITAILTSRFLLELQEANHMLDADDPLHSSRALDSRPSFISSLGGFVNPALLTRSDDDDGIELQVQSHSAGPGKEEGRGQMAPEVAASSCSTA
ncbi:hypothetical protein OH76DRAFT_1483375 [Lentinus brumalis]|uniref:DUF6533 domain-containing protein n=1 Tax=Lentinus brumalis TaxID=2498619 RepID=A0A371D9F6_9APHY|nr:hypothetical protein OH76DRAFT_1483375 [Polyporus brumalis]